MMRKGALTAVAIVLGVAAAAVTAFSCSSYSCAVDTDGCGDECSGDGTCGECNCASSDRACIDRCEGVDATVPDSAPFDAGPLADSALYALDAEVSALTVDTNFLYWIDQNGNIVRASKDGSSAPTVISSQQTQGIFAVGKAGVYYLGVDGRVAIIPHDGGAEAIFPYPPTFPNSELPIGTLVVDDANLITRRHRATSCAHRSMVEHGCRP